MSDILWFRKVLRKLGYPVPDANGTLPALITPRYAPIVDLMQISDAGLGEVAHASDRDAQVLFKGSPSVGFPIYAGGKAFSANGIVSASGLAGGGVVSPLGLITANTTPSGLGDAVNNRFSMPPEFEYFPNGREAVLQIFGNLSFSGFGVNGSGNPATVSLGYQISTDAGATWGAFIVLAKVQVDSTGTASGPVIAKPELATTASSALFNAGTLLRFAVSSDSTTNTGSVSNTYGMTISI